MLLAGGQSSGLCNISGLNFGIERSCDDVSVHSSTVVDFCIALCRFILLSFPKSERFGHINLSSRPTVFDPWLRVLIDVFLFIVDLSTFGILVNCEAASVASDYQPRQRAGSRQTKHKPLERAQATKESTGRGLRRESKKPHSGNARSLQQVAAQKAHESQQVIRYGCLFAKHDPVRYQGMHHSRQCIGGPGIEIGRMDEHVRRNHDIAYMPKCPFCSHQLSEHEEERQADFERHLLVCNPTQSQLCNVPEIMSHRQKNAWKRPINTNKPGPTIWALKYKAFFPEAASIPHPYYDYLKPTHLVQSNLTQIPDHQSFGVFTRNNTEIFENMRLPQASSAPGDIGVFTRDFSHQIDSFDTTGEAGIMDNLAHQHQASVLLAVPIMPTSDAETAAQVQNTSIEAEAVYVSTSDQGEASEVDPRHSFGGVFPRDMFDRSTSDPDYLTHDYSALVPQSYSFPTTMALTTADSQTFERRATSTHPGRSYSEPFTHAHFRIGSTSSYAGMTQLRAESIDESSAAGMSFTAWPTDWDESTPNADLWNVPGPHFAYNQAIEAAGSSFPETTWPAPDIGSANRGAGEDR